MLHIKNNFVNFLEPAYYKPSEFGIRLGNVIEVVVDTAKRPTGSFLAFNDISLVPYDAKLIDFAALSTEEVILFIHLIAIFRKMFLYLLETLAQ